MYAKVPYKYVFIFCYAFILMVALNSFKNNTVIQTQQSTV